MAEHDHHLTSRLLRKLRSQENSLYHCACSITHDISFVQTVCDLYPSLPVFANLRCGLWYVPGSQNTCYFKSTDGHTNEWNFSLTRLNLHVAQQAAVYGGCIVVDATRRGKSFPDALSKTIPAWTAVLNAAVSERQSVAEEVWDVKLHLPAWIPASEYQQIAGRLPVWTSRLRELQVQDSIEELARKLAKPLRPLWISQASTLQAEFVMQPADLDFTPVILVSASAPERERKLRFGAAGQGVESYEYVPGAGDDEESWSLGLTPPLFWAHHKELLDAGPHGIEAAVQRLLAGGTTAGCSSGPAVEACSHADMQLSWLGSTGIAICKHAAARQASIWQHAGAVIECCMHRKARVAARCANDEDGTSNGTGAWLTLHIPEAKADRLGLLYALPQAISFAAGQLCSGHKLIICDERGDDVSVCLAVAILQACFARCDARQAMSETEPLHDGESKVSASWHVATAAAGISLRPACHLQALMQHMDHDISRPADSGSACDADGKSFRGLAARQNSPSAAAANVDDANAASQTHLCRFHTCASCRVLACGVEDHKLNARRWLAFVTQHHTSARPSRSMLKQVSTFFHDRYGKAHLG